MDRLLRDGGDLDSMDRSLFSCDVSMHQNIFKGIVSRDEYFLNHFNCENPSSNPHQRPCSSMLIAVFENEER